MARSVVVSGPPAVGKTTVAKELASEFGLRHVSGGDVLKEMAAEHGFDSGGDDWWDTEDGMRFLSQRAQNPEFDRRLDDRLIGLFNRGGVVITSYTLPWLIGMSSSISISSSAKGGDGSDGPAGGIKIWLDGSHASSTERMRMRDNMPSDEAFAVTRERFDRNKELYKKIYGFDFGYDESVFDLVVRTDGRTARQVTDAAKESVRRMLCPS